MNLKLKAKRIEKGFTQSDFAKQLGIATNTYNRYELGKADMPGKIIKEILRILDCKFEDIFTI